MNPSDSASSSIELPVLPIKNTVIFPKLLSPLAVGRPAIVSSAVGIAPELSERTAGWTFDGSVADLSKRIAYVLDHLSDADRMGQAGKAWVENELSWEQVADKMRSVYLRATARLRSLQ